MADAEPPDDDGRSPAPPEGGAAEAGLAPAAAAAAVPATTDGASPHEQRARLAEDRLAEVLNAYRTLKKENEEFRERQARNLERRYEQRRERLLLKFIDVLDNLDRALEAAQTSYAGQPLLEGMILVRTQLLQTLQDEGLERIPVLGLPFDPGVSESVGTEAVTEAEQNQVVVKELLRGYRLNGRVARPSRVVIGVYPATESSSGETTALPAVAAAPAASPAPESSAPAVPPAAPPAVPTPPSAAAPESDPSTAETTRIPAPPPPSPVPEPPPLPPRRKGRG